jgi:hypothetical protein
LKTIIKNLAGLAQNILLNHESLAKRDRTFIFMMKPAIDPLWVTDIEAAKVLQNSLREKVIREDQLEKVERIAGVDVAFAENRTITKAAVVILSYPDLTILETAIA